MGFPFTRFALRLENGDRPLYWGALPGGGDGWTSDKDSAYLWSDDLPLADGVASHRLPEAWQDLHGRWYTLMTPDVGHQQVVKWAEWCLESNPAEPTVRVVPWEDEHE